MKKRIGIILAVAFLIFCPVSFVHAADKTPDQLVNEAKTAISEIPVAEVKRLMDSGKEMILLDVRDKDEYETGHIPGSVNISRGTLDFKARLIIPDKNKKIIVHCGTDLRSPLATKSLNDLGYKKAINMTGGLKAWKEAGYPIVK